MNYGYVSRLKHSRLHLTLYRSIATCRLSLKGDKRAIDEIKPYGSIYEFSLPPFHCRSIVFKDLRSDILRLFLIFTIEYERLIMRIVNLESSAVERY